MPAVDVVRTQTIASLRIHVERVIKKLKNFHIWDSLTSPFICHCKPDVDCLTHLCNVQDPIHDILAIH